MEKNNGQISGYDASQEPLVIHQSIIERFKEDNNTGDLIALYVFYYHTAKWQRTNQIKANDVYVKKCLKWSVARYKRAKSKLKDLGVVAAVPRKDDSGKIKEWYTKVNFVWSFDKVNQLVNNGLLDSRGTENHPVDLPEAGEKTTNALSLNKRNASTLNNKTVTTSSKCSTECFVITDLLIDFVSSKHQIIVNSKKRNTWATHVERLHKVDGVEYETITNAVSWYVDHAGQPQHTPVGRRP